VSTASLISRNSNACSLVIGWTFTNEKLKTKDKKSKKAFASQQRPSRLIKTVYTIFNATVLIFSLKSNSAFDNFFFSSSVNLAGFPCMLCSFSRWYIHALLLPKYSFDSLESFTKAFVNY